MKTWIYKWLPIIFGCHQRPERSFLYKGERFPICARCTGELIGIFIGIMGIYWVQIVPLYMFFILLLPLVIDGTIQMVTSYTSNNSKRLLTGILFGYGLFSLFVLSNIWVFELGRKFRGF